MAKPFIIILTIISTSVFAQKYDFEIMTGPNLSTLRSNPENNSNYTSKIGLTAGVGNYIYFRPDISVGLRLLYQREIVRGYFPFSYSYYKGDMELTTYFDKLTLPVSGRYTVGSKIKFTVEVGGFLSYQFNETVKDYTALSPEFNDFAQATKQYTMFDAGLFFGLSIKVPVNDKLGFQFSVFDNLGLIDIGELDYSKYQYFKTNTLNATGGLVILIR